MSPAEADALLFADALACEDEFPLELRAARGTRETAEAARRAESTLRAIGAIEEASAEDSDAHAHDAALARVEAKVDLALGLLAMVAGQNRSQPAPVRVHWSRRGMRFAHAGAYAPGAALIVGAYLLAALPLPVELPLTVVHSAPGEHGHVLWLRFPDQPAGFQSAVERQLFRRHRRLIAESRAHR